MICRGRTNSLIPSLTSKAFIFPYTFILMLLCSAFIKQRCIQTWASCYSSLDNSIPVVPFYMINHSALLSTPTTTQLSSIFDYSWVDSISSPLSSLEDDYDLDFNSGPNPSSSAQMYTIRTKFEPSLERNTKVEYKTKEDKKLYNFTEKERGFAALATNCETLEDLDAKVVYIFDLYFLLLILFS